MENNKNQKLFDDIELPKQFLEDLQREREDYRAIKIPEELSAVVQNAIEKTEESRRNRIWTAFECAGGIVAACFIAIILSLNLSPVFAKAAYELPLIGNLCRIFTFRDYRFEDETTYIKAQVPAIANTGNSELEARVNREIREAIQKELKDSEAQAEEYYQAFIETGGKPEEYIPVEITIDYEIKLLAEDRVSFVISKADNRFSAYYDTLFYNIDIKSGKALTLRDCLGEDYKQLVADSIRNTISGWTKEQKALLWEDVQFEAIITENTDFYLDGNGNVVIVFPKYEVAAGAAGILEFTVSDSY